MRVEKGKRLLQAINVDVQRQLIAVVYKDYQIRSLTLRFSERIKDSHSRFIVRKSSYQVYSYFCQCPSNGISISARLKEKVSAWGFCLEEFSILVKDTPDDQQWVVVHHIFSVEKTDFAR